MGPDLREIRPVELTAAIGLFDLAPPREAVERSLSVGGYDAAGVLLGAALHEVAHDGRREIRVVVASSTAAEITPALRERLIGRALGKAVSAGHRATGVSVPEGGAGVWTEAAWPPRPVTAIEPAPKSAVPVDPLGAASPKASDPPSSAVPAAAA